MNELKSNNFLTRFSTWLKTQVRPLPAERRSEVVEDIAQSASPGFDFFLLVVLSCMIATMGLITDSPAVIIGAMLLAPLMSPIIGIGLASITGNANLLQKSLSALLRGALLAVGLATLVTLINNQIPFIAMQELPREVLSRTRPTPIDLAIALAGGIAAAYALTQPALSAALPGVAIATALMPPLCTVGIGLALGQWAVAGGAALLFLTNAVTIAFAAVLVFFIRGFARGKPVVKDRRLPQGLVLSAVLTALLLIPLTYYSVQFFQDASENRLINSVVHAEVSKIANAELTEIKINRNGSALDMVLTIRTNSNLRYEQVTDLQKAIVSGIHMPVSLKVNQIFAERLDPLIPPTPTPTPTATPSATPGPSPTATRTPTLTPTALPSSTSTPTQTETPTPTHTPTVTPTVSQGRIVFTLFPAPKIYQSPGGPVIGDLYYQQPITILYRRVPLNGLIWVEIQDLEGRVGWVPEVYIQLILPTSTSTPAASSTPTLTAAP